MNIVLLNENVPDMLNCSSIFTKIEFGIVYPFFKVQVLDPILYYKILNYCKCPV